MGSYTKVTGYYGFTVDGFGVNSIDPHGRVDRVIFSITYTNRQNDIEFTMSDGANDWGAKMSNGELIPLRNPQILFQNRDNTIVQFDLMVPHPSNAPCFLAYTSENAWFKVQEISDMRPFAPNTISGHFGFTTKGHGGTPEIGHGNVNRVIFTFPFTMRATDVEFTISKGDTHWAARMGNGQLIALKNPEVLYTNRDGAAVKFTMEAVYPSDSPCLLVYRSPDAWYRVQEVSQ
jgi:hypothetical protein